MDIKKLGKKHIKVAEEENKERGRRSPFLVLGSYSNVQWRHLCFILILVFKATSQIYADTMRHPERENRCQTATGQIDSAGGHTDVWADEWSGDLIQSLWELDDLSCT